MKKHLITAATVAATAAAVYFLSVVSYAFPGESARLQVLWAGLDPAGASSHPLTAFFAGLFGGGNAIAPVAGTIAAVAVFLLVSVYVRGVITSEHAKPHADVLGLVAGAVAAFVFITSPAVHEAASHLEPRLFDAAWAFVTVALLIPYARVPKLAAWAFPALLGAMTAFGFCDSPIFAVLAIVSLFAITSVELQRGSKPYGALTVFAAFFLIVFFIAVDAFDLELTPLLEGSVREFAGYFTVQGWVFVAVFAIVPFLVAFFACPRAFNDRPGIVQWLFHVSMSFFAILAVATPLSPSSLMGKSGVFPVMSCAFAAAFTGYLAAFWWLYRSRPVGMVSGVLLGFVVAFASLWNLFTFDGDRGAFADEVARRVIADMGDRKWLVTDGTLDDHILLVAKAEGHEVNLVALHRDLETKYLEELGKKVVETKIGGEKNGDLALSLSLGVLPFVQDWFAADPTVAKSVAIWGAPDLWYASKMKPVPEFLFFGADKDRKPDWSDWKRFDKLLEAPAGWGSFHWESRDPVELLRLSLRRHMGFVANNRGVWLQDEKRDDEAFAMYELVLNEIDPDNVCALFNEVEMAGGKHAKALAKKRDLERRVADIVADKTRRYAIWRLGSYYGYIRNPDMFIRLGFSWARSGRPGDALAQIRRAIDFVPAEKKKTLLNMMAALYASESEQLKSRRIYEAILARDRNNHDALMGMVRINMMDGDEKAAAEYLDRAVKAAPADSSRAHIEAAMLAMMNNDIATAKDRLRKVVDADAANLQAWGLLAAVTMQQMDAAKDAATKTKLEKEIRDYMLPEMEKHTNNPYDYYVQSTKAFLLMRQGESRRRDARAAFEAAARARPDLPVAQDIVLGLDISLDDKAAAERHARDVLRRNRNAPLANYVMGSISIGRARYSEAEAFLRRAVNTAKPSVLAINDLAEVLRRTGSLEEAEKFARKAVEVAPEFYLPYETLAVVLLEQDRGLEEAATHIRKAIELSKASKGKGTDPDVRLYITLARIQVKNGDKKGARASLRKVQSKASELTEFERGEFEEIRKSVR